MPVWLSWVLVTLLSVVTLLALLAAAAHYYYRTRFVDNIVRIFEERPLFIVPKGKPLPGAEDVRFPTAGGLTLRGCYLRAAGRRRGVILFGLEFGSNRWAAAQYCGRLLDAGYDVFAYEPRCQGESDQDPGYSPLQWVTDRDLDDARAAVRYLKGRPDAPADGIGLLGVSKGGSVGMALAAEEPWVRCLATDGAYAAYTTMVPYMKRWVGIYSNHTLVQAIMPDWLYGTVGLAAMRRSAARRGVRYLTVERAARRLRQPLLMIHGGADTYIKPEMAAALFAKAGSKRKELWVVPKAKHNQALHTAGDEYPRKLVAFFDRHLSDPAAAADPPPDAPAEAPTPVETAALPAAS